jgi:hypothetical protein
MSIPGCGSFVQQRGVTPLSNYRPATICAMPAKMADEVSNIVKGVGVALKQAAG